MIQIAIDGACKGNGKVDCISSAGVIIRHDDQWHVHMDTECNSTNQRGEMYALLGALIYCAANPGVESQIITDSEYLFNTITKEWYRGWESRGWLTSQGEPVKNKELWQNIIRVYQTCATAPMFYHIKGHLIPDGGQAAFGLLAQGPEYLYAEYLLRAGKMDLAKVTKAQELSMQNNGFELPTEILLNFVALNGVADRIAVKALIDKTK